ncbi:cytochrome c oxidase subunit 7C, mitochondrial-like [Ovis aries]|nr:cytochrome c oxidase subunit 7C, mitochondrial-like [Ovis aries]
MPLLTGSEEDGVDGGWEGNSDKQTKEEHQRSELLSPLMTTAAVSSAFSLCIFRRASSSAVLGQSVQRLASSVVHRSHYEEGPGKNIPLSVESKWRFLAMMTWFFGFGFAVPFLIVRHQPLKK